MTTPTSGGLWRRAPTPLLAASALGVAALLVWAGYAIRGQARVEAAPAAAIAPSSATSDRPVVDPQAQTMKLGMDALYARRDPVAAAARFREVLAMNGEHYGATYQLAVALDLAGAPGASRPLWAKVLAMATAIGDAESAARARAPLAEIEQLPAAPPADPAAAEMKLGLEALHGKGDAAAAVIHFRRVLEKNPTHYGAHFQLATALDRAGKPAEARPYWAKVLKMAEAIKDTSTAETARARLAAKP